MEIKSIPKKDLKQVVAVHKDSFKGFFLTELGDHFLEVYYDCVRKNEKGILLGYYEDEELFGFCAATTISQKFNAHLVKKNIFRFFFIGIRLVVTRIPSLVRLFKNFAKTNATIPDDGNYSELLSIGVSNKKQGLGIGKKLLIQLEREMKLNGCSKLSLTTDYNNNEKAIQFYKGLGYDIFYDFVAYPNRAMYRMIKKID